jgi:hypothetical protein
LPPRSRKLTAAVPRSWLRTMTFSPEAVYRKLLSLSFYRFRHRLWLVYHVQGVGSASPQTCGNRGASRQNRTTHPKQHLALNPGE